MRYGRVNHQWRCAELGLDLCALPLRAQRSHSATVQTVLIAARAPTRLQAARAHPWLRARRVAGSRRMAKKKKAKTGRAAAAVLRRCENHRSSVEILANGRSGRRRRAGTAFLKPSERARTIVVVADDVDRARQIDKAAAARGGDGSRTRSRATSASPPRPTPGGYRAARRPPRRRRRRRERAARTAEPKGRVIVAVGLPGAGKSPSTS